jgi:hypothetical protein
MVHIPGVGAFVITGQRSMMDEFVSTEYEKTRLTVQATVGRTYVRAYKETAFQKLFSCIQGAKIPLIHKIIEIDSFIVKIPYRIARMMKQRKKKLHVSVCFSSPTTDSR